MMTLKRRMALTGVTALALTVAGVGLVQAGARDAAVPADDATTAAAPQVVAAAAPAMTDGVDEATLDVVLTAFQSQDETGAAASEKHARVPGLGRGVLRHHARRLVHAEITVDTPKHGIVTWAGDHGTLTDVSGGTLRISEEGDRSATIATDADTKVHARPDHDPIHVADLKVGDEVIVVSLLTDDGYVSKRVVVLPAAAEPKGDDTNG